MMRPMCLCQPGAPIGHHPCHLRANCPCQAHRCVLLAGEPAYPPPVDVLPIADFEQDSTEPRYRLAGASPDPWTMPAHPDPAHGSGAVEQEETAE